MEADRTGRLMADPSDAIARIGDVVGFISNNAGLTSILAANATI